MDNEKDNYIKSNFIQDDLISKRADNVFDNFFKGEIKMEEEKVVKNDSTKDKKIKSKKIIAIAATLMIVFLGANVYAATKGYNNIFFVIKNIFSGKEITDSNQILTDREIIISYQPIELNKGLKIQINKLVIAENKATLYLKVDKVNSSIDIKNYTVYDVTEGNKKVIGNQEAIDKPQNIYIEELNLDSFSNNTKKIVMDIEFKDYDKIASLEIDLEKKEINILTGSDIELEKISEVELKEFLSNVLRFNYFNEKSSIEKIYTDEEYKNDVKVFYALEVLNTRKKDKKTVHKVIEETTGEKIEELRLAGKIVLKDDENYKRLDPTISEIETETLCLEISDIKYVDGIYTVDCIYVYTTQEDYNNNRIEQLDKYKTTVKFKINEKYDYVKYCLVDDFVGVMVQDNNSNNNETNNSETNEQETIVPEENNNSNTNSDAYKTEEVVDNYASTMKWKTLQAVGMSSIMPEDWNIQYLETIYSGTEDTGHVSTQVDGLAKGINKETNEIINSNMIIRYYMPEYTEECKNLDEYAQKVAERAGTTYMGTGSISKNNGIRWASIAKDNSVYYCSFVEETNYGFIIEVECDNFNNYKVINITDWILARIQYTSF